MALVLLAYGLALACGLAAAEGTRWGFGLAAREALGFRHLITPGFYQPLRALVVVAAAPTLLLGWARRSWRGRPGYAAVAAAIGLGWSFLQGVAIVTHMLGFT